MQEGEESREAAQPVHSPRSWEGGAGSGVWGGSEQKTCWLTAPLPLPPRVMEADSAEGGREGGVGGGVHVGTHPSPEPRPAAGPVLGPGTSRRPLRPSTSRRPLLRGV